MNDEIASVLRSALERHPEVELAIVFGSAATGTDGFESDLDIAVSAAEPLSAQDKIELIEDLAEAVGRPIDLVDLRCAGEPLLGEIFSCGKRILGSPGRYGALLSRHLIDSADFLPYRERILAERRRGWIGR